MGHVEADLSRRQNWARPAVASISFIVFVPIAHPEAPAGTVGSITGDRDIAGRNPGSEQRAKIERSESDDEKRSRRVPATDIQRPVRGIRG